MAKKLIKNGIIVDGNGGEPINDGIVVIENEKITYVGNEREYQSDGAETVIDAQGGTILPGFIDTHVHMMFEYSPIAKRLETPFSFMYYQAANYLKATLHAGITSVRDALGADLGVKKAIEVGLISGPRMQLSINALTITGGHGDGYTVSGNTVDLLASDYPGMPNGKCDGVEEVRKKTREMLRAGAEVIKVHATGGVLSATDHPEFTQFSLEELKVIVEEARFRKGVKVMAHAQGAEGIKNAVRAGVHSIEHGIFIDDEAIELMLENGTYLVPTLLAPVAVLETAKEVGMPDSAVAKSKEVIEQHHASIAKAHQAGVKIAMGTDAGVMKHGTNLRELGLMRNAGMSTMETIVASTKTAAECLGWNEQVGTLETGKLADIIVVNGNPLDEIDALANNDTIQVVIKHGQIEKNILS
ncbi:amidohydrolase family protein [Virgibacillus pantothenticus]|uniref:metal-dependent hydrolase family protein n=1 Tax=Virgibacillus pantothenticus TaxID=1473 RepID=UPI001C21B854|nr:amidohydrolase family protein [Virgibacillus pantothenticus]MBU8564929.1 amidohydrolase family protein [Virgibacillus pantothenticus]MBU8599237.1 amidohydrolase family protein [Virgibacillus pantothenticus]MBU8633360.1 amidohydrolase family protein [Virgibacillus pantothenticus]MBU8640979.1 amidohydrolase family protein [Virgibacillus pantothenticus]MBU8645092.1 amidohydrolase family protein [Virgibacillus pantothenticus]